MRDIIRKIKTFLLHDNSFFRTFDAVFGQNPVFVYGLALTPIIAASITLKYSVITIIIMFFIFTGVTIFARLFGGKIKLYRRELVFSIVGSLIFPLASKVCDFIDVNAIHNLGIYIPIIIVDSIVIVKSLEYSESKNDFLIDLKNIILTLIGFSIPCLLLGMIREYLAFGTLWDVVITDVKIPSASNIYMGFIFLGLIASIYQYLSIYRKKQININQEVNKNAGI